jgi:phosphate:Na+ symporter
MKFSFFDLLTLLGALGFFIFAMKVMSEGIQKIAGNRLRSVLASMTDKSFSGILTGLGITSLIQSSSATTVMVVSFVNAGLFSLRQSIGVIMGANIGTTMTAWLIALLGFSKFSIATYSLPIIAIAFPLLFFKKQQYRYIAEFLIGFALLFMGIAALKASVPVLGIEQLSQLKEWADMGFWSIFLFVGLGTLLTVIIQSSSAAMALTLALCANGLPLELGAAIVMGENIGTTITANLAALIGNASAKRSALAHFIFNVFGVIWLLVVFKWFIHGTANIASSMGWWANPFDNPSNSAAVTRTLALFHTSFNIINTLVLVWFIPQIEKLVVRIISTKRKTERPGLKYLSFNLLETPEMALSAVRNELYMYINITSKMLGGLENLIDGTKKKKIGKILGKMDIQEEGINRYHKEITKYLIKLNQKPLSKEIARRSQLFLSISHNLENIADLVHTISNSMGKELENEVVIPPEYHHSLQVFIKAIREQLNLVSDQFGRGRSVNRTEFHEALELLRDSDVFQVKPSIYSDLEEGDYPIETGLVFAKLIMWAEQVSFKMDNILKGLYKYL